jgi:hypothetical protein
VKILGKVENLVCRILRSFNTGDENGFDVHDEQGKYQNFLSLLTVQISISRLISLY